jgi:hypothetical protein
MNTKKVEIIEYLEKNSFPIHDGSYDYLIKMPIYNLTFEKKDELIKESDDKHKVLVNIEEEEETTTWSNDLSELEKKLT